MGTRKIDLDFNNYYRQMIIKVELQRFNKEKYLVNEKCKPFPYIKMKYNLNTKDRRSNNKYI